MEKDTMTRVRLVNAIFTDVITHEKTERQLRTVTLDMSWSARTVESGRVHLHGD